MLYTDDEIISSYRDSKHKRNQLQILADLNACPVSAIVDVLLKHGYEYSGEAGYPTPTNAVLPPPVVKIEKPNSIIFASQDTQQKEVTSKDIIENIMPKDIVEEIANMSENAFVSKEPIQTPLEAVVKTQLDSIQLVAPAPADEPNETKDQDNQTPNVKPKKVRIGTLISDEELRRRYLDEGESAASIGKSIGVDSIKMAKYIVNHGMVRNKRSASKQENETAKVQAKIQQTKGRGKKQKALVQDPELASVISALDAKIETLYAAADKLHAKADTLAAAAGHLEQLRDGLNLDIDAFLKEAGINP